MLFRVTPKRHSRPLIHHAVGLIDGFVAGLLQRRADQAFLDGLRPEELEELGLRRSEDNRYRFF
jgi:hypothetical protein